LINSNWVENQKSALRGLEKCCTGAGIKKTCLAGSSWGIFHIKRRLVNIILMMADFFQINLHFTG
jgi:hypothetical protein